MSIEYRRTDDGGAKVEATGLAWWLGCAPWLLVIPIVSGAGAVAVTIALVRWVWP